MRVPNVDEVMAPTVLFMTFFLLLLTSLKLILFHPDKLILLEYDFFFKVLFRVFNAFIKRCLIEFIVKLVVTVVLLDLPR